MVLQKASLSMTRNVRHYWALVCLLLLSACATQPYQISEAEREAEIAQGKALHQHIGAFFGFYKHDVLQGYVQRIGEQLAVHSRRNQLIYRFTLLDSAEPLIFALPGGYVYISRGLAVLLNSETELAFLLAKQLAHIELGHVNAQFLHVDPQLMPGDELSALTEKSLTLGFFSQLKHAIRVGYSKRQMQAADRSAANYLAKSGYDLHAILGASSFFEPYKHIVTCLFCQKLYGLHDGFKANLADTINMTELSVNNNQEPIKREQRFLTRLEGVVVGDSKIIQANDALVHHGLGIALQPPVNWQVIGRPNALWMFPRDKHSYIKLSQAPSIKEATPEKRSIVSSEWSVASQETIFGNVDILRGHIDVENGQKILIEMSAKNKQLWEDSLLVFKRLITTVKISDQVQKVKTLSLLVDVKDKRKVGLDSEWVNYLNQWRDEKSIAADQYIKVIE